MVKTGKISGAGFPRTARLLQHAAFERVYAGGHRFFSGHMTVFFLLQPAAPGGARVGFTVGRALGGAVTRNRIRRRVREAVRHELPPLQAGLSDRGLRAEVVINPKKSVLAAATPALQAEVNKVFAAIQQAAPGVQPQAPRRAERKPR